MRKTVLLLSLLISLMLSARPAQPVPHFVAAKVGVVLIGTGSDGLALAADGSSLNADGRISQEQKLFPAGKQGAVAIAGAVSLQDPVGRRVREEVNVARIAGEWLAGHADLDIKAADHDLNATVAAAVNRFVSKRDPGTQKGAFKFAIVSAGFLDDKPVVMVTRYFLPMVQGKPMRTERTVTPAKAGELWILGSAGLRAASLERKSAVFTTATKDPAVRNYINLFHQILRTAESGGSGVTNRTAPPNRLATVTLKEGFAAASPQ